MTDTESLHELFRENEDFDELITGMNSEQSAHELHSAVEGVGEELAEELELQRGEWKLDPVTIGWIRICWEAYHEQPHNDKLFSYRGA